MMRYGFEKEYFVFKRGVLSLAKGLPMDECGYLAETRGEPHMDPLKAAYLMLAEESRLTQQAIKLGLRIRTLDTYTLTAEFRQIALREYGKNQYPDGRGNIYNLDYKPEDTLSRAGLHVHFSNTQDAFYNSGKPYGVAGIINIPKYIQTLDKAFALEIEAAKRLPGFYEMKAHGFEYRSLPASIDVVKVASVLSEIRG